MGDASGYHLIDFGLAVHPAARRLFDENCIAPLFPGFDPAQHAAVSDLGFAGTAAFQQEQYTAADDVQSLLLVGASLYGVPSPWHAHAMAGDIKLVSLLRAQVVAEAAAHVPDSAAVTLYSAWLAELPPVLKQLASWALPRTTATVADLKDLRAVLQVGLVLSSVPFDLAGQQSNSALRLWCCA